jgi:hypothetical protein
MTSTKRLQTEIALLWLKEKRLLQVTYPVLLHLQAKRTEISDNYRERMKTKALTGKLKSNIRTEEMQKKKTE